MKKEPIKRLVGIVAILFFFGVMAVIISNVKDDKNTPENARVQPTYTPTPLATETSTPIEASPTHTPTSIVIVTNESPTSSPITYPSYSVKEYRIYRSVIDTPMSISEEQAFKNTAELFGVNVEEARLIVRNVQESLLYNGWFGSPESEIRHSYDWAGEQP